MTVPRIDDATVSHTHAETVDQVVAALATDPAAGLDPDEAERRLLATGPNRVTAEETTTRLRLLLRQFDSVLIWTLAVAAAISGLVLDDWIDAGVIAAIVLGNALLGFVQETRAEHALADLKEMAAPEARVVRTGRARSIPAATVVPGDCCCSRAETGSRPMPGCSRSRSC